ncbi:MAG: serine hydrolase domain-containing protein [Alphaproteobacteria bacterium]
MRRLSALLVLTACLLSAPPALAADLPTASPVEVGLSAERLTRIDDAMAAYVREGELAGVTFAIMRHGKLVYLHMEGSADIEAGKRIARNTIFRIHSMTKPIAAVAAMILVEEGRLKLTDKVADYIPEFADTQVFVGGTAEAPELAPIETPITVYQLLTHTSGMTAPGFFETPVTQIYEAANLWDYAAPLAAFAKKAAALPLASQPGATYDYGISTDVLGRVIEVASGQTFDVFLKERIFDPLGMTDTAFFVPPEKAARFAAAYKHDEDGALAPATDRNPALRWLPENKLFLGGGGLVSTVDDYLRFSQMMLKGGALDGTRILSRKTVELMTTSQVPYEKLASFHQFMPGYGIGLGFGVLDDVAVTKRLGSKGEYFWSGAANTFFLIDPKEELIAILLPQFYPFAAYPLQEELRTLSYQAIDD